MGKDGRKYILLHDGTPQGNETKRKERNGVCYGLLILVLDTRDYIAEDLVEHRALLRSV